MMDKIFAIEERKGKQHSNTLSFDLKLLNTDLSLIRIKMTKLHGHSHTGI